MSDRTNLAALVNGATRRQAIVGVAITFGGLTLGSTEALGEPRRGDFPFRGNHSPGASVQSQPEARVRGAYGRQTIRSGHPTERSD